MSDAGADSAADLPTESRDFAPRLIAWQRQHGRHGLPWQGQRDPYVVWLSEIMLQQTQVSTVLGYFPRFLARFPNVQALASAQTDEVMSLWSGLGYYSRARNLHRCAQDVVGRFGGCFPTTAQALETLPGIGASTAAAIAAFCFGERISILDGNVRRVLTRLLTFGDDLAVQGHQRRLWAHAQQLLPQAPEGDDMAAYTQGLMDLGATVCHRTRPACERCPVSALCQARAQGNMTDYPVKSRQLKRRHESWWLPLLLRQDGGSGVAVWLERRPDTGIWAGLYCTPVLNDEAAAWELLPLACHPEVIPMEAISHSLTHIELRLHPLLLKVRQFDQAPWSRDGGWVPASALVSHGVPTPLRHLLARVMNQ